MDLDLNGKTAIVTGGTKGIGRSIVEALVGEGVAVAFCARTASEVAATADVMAAGGGRVVGHAVDVSDGDALAGWVHEAATMLGGLDIVVANVSALAVPDVEESWQQGFATDLMGTVRLVQAALPHLEKSKAGSIVTVASASAREIDFAAGPYGALKAAVIHYTQGLAHQLAAMGVRANSVSPGNIYFQGGVWQAIEQANREFFDSALAHNPTGRMGRPEEVARVVAFLASPAASFITASNLVIDGALTRGVQY